MKIRNSKYLCVVKCSSSDKKWNFNGLFELWQRSWLCLYLSIRNFKNLSLFPVQGFLPFVEHGPFELKIPVFVGTHYRDSRNNGIDTLAFGTGQYALQNVVLSICCDNPQGHIRPVKRATEFLYGLHSHFFGFKFS